MMFRNKRQVRSEELLSQILLELSEIASICEKMSSLLEDKARLSPKSRSKKKPLNEDNHVEVNSSDSKLSDN